MEILVIDYYETEFEIDVLTLVNIDIDKCNTSGKLIIKETFSNNIEEKIIFDLSLTYPNVKIHCELNEVSENTLIKSTSKNIKSLITIISKNVVLEKND